MYFLTIKIQDLLLLLTCFSCFILLFHYQKSENAPLVTSLPSSCCMIPVILRHEYRTSIKTALKIGSPMLQRNVLTLQQNLIFCQFK